MLEQIIAAIDKKSKEEVTISKGVAFVIVVGAFILGVIMGSCGKKKAVKKALKAKEAEEYEDFDADEYVRSLNLDNEE